MIIPTRGGSFTVLQNIKQNTEILQYTARYNENMKNGVHIAVNASAGYSVKHRAYGVCYSAGEQPHKPGSAYRGNGGFAGENNAPAKR